MDGSRAPYICTTQRTNACSLMAMTQWEDRMYCVRCDVEGLMEHATVVFEGETLCSDHYHAKRELRDSGNNNNHAEA